MASLLLEATSSLNLGAHFELPVLSLPNANNPTIGAVRAALPVSSTSGASANISTACQAALSAANRNANSACSALSSYTSSTPSNVPAKYNTIRTICGDSNCQQQFNNVIEAFTSGPCAQDTVTGPLQNGTLATITLSYIGYAAKAGFAALCQKTSDQKGYCSISNQADPFSANWGSTSTSGVTPASTKSNASDYNNLTLLISKKNSSVCTDCTKNELAAILTVPNLPAEILSAYQNISNQFNTFCGSNLTTITGSGGLTNGAGNSATGNAASLALFTSALIVVLGIF